MLSLQLSLVAVIFYKIYKGVLMLPSVSVVSKSACRLGSSGFAVRSSSRALGGFVASVGFVRPALAAQFARFWAALLPAGCCGCVVRRSGRLFLVCPLPSFPPLGVLGFLPVLVAGLLVFALFRTPSPSNKNYFNFTSPAS